MVQVKNFCPILPPCCRSSWSLKVLCSWTPDKDKDTFLKVLYWLHFVIYFMPLETFQLNYISYCTDHYTDCEYAQYVNFSDTVLVQTPRSFGKLFFLINFCLWNKQISNVKQTTTNICTKHIRYGRKCSLGYFFVYMVTGMKIRDNIQKTITINGRMSVGMSKY